MIVTMNSLKYNEDMKKKIKLILTDMDGTLLNQNKQLPKNGLNVIQRCLDKGIIFGAASGRQLSSLKSFFPGLEDQLFFVCNNGTYASYKQNTIHRSLMEKDLIPELIQLARSLEETWVVYTTPEHAYIESNDPRLLKQCNQFYSNVVIVDDLTLIEEQPNMITICNLKGTEKYAWPVFKKYCDRFQVVVTTDIWMDIFNKNEGKGVPIQYLQEMMNITPEETLVFGDYLNDVSMFPQAYYSYAMENAHPDVIKQARFIAPSCETGGVITVIEQFLSKEDNSL